MIPAPPRALSRVADLALGRHTALAAIIAGGWLVSSEYQLAKYFSGATLVVLSTAGVALVAGTVVALVWFLRHGRDRIGVGWLYALFAAMIAAYLVLYPIAARRTAFGGSDADDALRIASAALVRGGSPYAHTTYLGNPISPMPGAIVLATPFAAMGRVSLQNICWLAAFVGFAATFFRSRATALVFLLVVTAGSLNTLDAFVAGGDYPINGWYVTIAVALFLKTNLRDRLSPAGIATGIFFGLTLSSRFVYPLVFVPLAGAYLLQRRGLLTALSRLSTPLIVATTVTLVVYVRDPVNFSPLHVSTKLAFLGPRVRHAAIVAFPVLTGLVACAGFLRPLSIERLFLIAGLAASVALLAPGAWRLVDDHFSQAGWALTGYATPAVTFVALWAFRAIERDFSPAASRWDRS